MKYFKAGTLVRVAPNYSPQGVAGKVGMVLENEDSCPFVRFKEHIDGHDCDGLCEYGYGWSVPVKYLSPYKIQLENK